MSQTIEHKHRILTEAFFRDDEFDERFSEKNPECNRGGPPGYFTRDDLKHTSDISEIGIENILDILKKEGKLNQIIIESCVKKYKANLTPEEKKVITAINQTYNEKLDLFGIDTPYFEISNITKHLKDETNPQPILEKFTEMGLLEKNQQETNKLPEYTAPYLNQFSWENEKQVLNALYFYHTELDQISKNPHAKTGIVTNNNLIKYTIGLHVEDIVSALERLAFKGKIQKKSSYDEKSEYIMIHAYQAEPKENEKLIISAIKKIYDEKISETENHDPPHKHNEEPIFFKINELEKYIPTDKNIETQPILNRFTEMGLLQKSNESYTSAYLNTYM